MHLKAANGSVALDTNDTLAVISQAELQLNGSSASRNMQPWFALAQQSAKNSMLLNALPVKEETSN